MFDTADFLMFLAMASLIAVSPGPGILYVAARTLAGGRDEGIASSLGTGAGGTVHIVAGAFGVSAVVMASAEAFTLLKLVGAAYLVWIGIKTLRDARAPIALVEVSAAGSRKAFRDGIIVEIFNPKTAAFFLAFIPQFVNPAQGSVALQFMILGMISVTLNTLADVVVAHGASVVRRGVEARPRLIRRLRESSGILMCGLGVSLAWARRPA